MVSQHGLLRRQQKALLLPGEHVITVRQNGYQDFTEKIAVQPGQKHVIRVAMEVAATGVMPAVMSTVKITINPSRAAVFLHGLFVGHVGEFEGARRGLLIAPGPHKIKVALPGYQTFETEINPLPKQEVELKTDLIKHDGAVSDTSLKPGARANVPPPPPQPVVPPPQH